jgi:hypothetical protein
MKERFKILFAWTMIVVLFYNFEFSFLVFELSIELNRNVVKEKLSKEETGHLELLKITDESSIIRKDNHEIIYRGKIYDVKKEIRKDGISFFYCIHDKSEEGFYEVLNSIVKINSDSGNENQKQDLFGIQNHFAKKYFLIETIFFDIDHTLQDKIFVNDDCIVSNNFSNILTPPPRG